MTLRINRVFSLGIWGLLLLAACGGTAASSGGDGTEPRPPDQERPKEPGSSVSPVLSATQQAELDELQSRLAEVSDFDSAGLAERYPTSFATSLGYDPGSAAGLDLVQRSALALNDGELAALGSQGFVVTERTRFPTFAYGYQSIYLEDLPVFVSADSILYAVHRSYDAILQAIETASLIPSLGGLLDSMRARLGSGSAAALGDQAVRDVDVYLTVAASLLAGTQKPPVAGGSESEIAKLFSGAQTASGWVGVELFGVPRDVDFSQFEPRGHYTDSEELKRYFRAMIWLGRIDFRIIETQPDLSQVFHRRQLEAAYALGALIDAAGRADFDTIDRTVEAFVGEPDNMTLGELDGLLADLGVTSLAGLASVPDATIAQTVLSGGYGTQRISSHIMINGVGAGTMPLSSTFMLFGQRYVVDSHVFSNVVYDRVQGGSVYRMMPNPLDAAFAALGNNQAGALLSSELEQYGYAPDLASMRILADAHPASFWEANLYNLWLDALRRLSPSAELADPAAAGLPSVAATESWGRRLLGTQLASWAELRHDTILYAKQSYTGGAACEFPDAYVEPQPEFFARLVKLAERGQTLVQSLDLSQHSWLAEQVPAWFDRLASIAARLERMAQHQRSGAPHDAADVEFINQAVSVDQGCGEPIGSTGWYAELFYDKQKSVEYDPTIADVHTQPTDEVGSPVGRVLHVGTGMPRLMVVTAGTCTGPRAYVGLASSYFERITEDFERLTDETWAEELKGATPPDPFWAVVQR